MYKQIKIINFKKLDFFISKEIFTPFINLSKQKKEKLKDLFIKKGMYDGDILGCVNYKKKNKNLILECRKIKFFDKLMQGIDKDLFPKMIAVNALIFVEDSLLLIKRPKGVYDQPGEWDFPAGIVPFSTSMEERVFDRIEKDTGIKKNYLILREFLHFIVILPHAIAFFYPIKCKIKKELLNEFLKKRLKKEDFILLPLKEIPLFLLSKKFVFPDILKNLNKMSIN